MNNVFLDGTHQHRRRRQRWPVHPGFAGRGGRVQGSDLHLQRGVRPQPRRLHLDQHEERGQAIPRHGVRVLPQQRAGCAAAVRHHGKDFEAAVQSVRRKSQRPHLCAEVLHQERPAAVLLLQLRRDSRLAAHRRQLRRPAAPGSVEWRPEPAVPESGPAHAAGQPTGFKVGQVSGPAQWFAKRTDASSAAIPISGNIIPPSEWSRMRRASST